MATRNPTIQDVAAAAGVSVATVSRTLQFPDRVAEDTKIRVRVAIEQLNYYPNAQARNLRTARTGLIIALVPDITNPFFAGVIRGIEAVAKQQGYSVLLGDTQYDAENEQRYGDMISAREADGLITLLPRIPRIRRSDGLVPVINICETLADPQVNTISVDNATAVRDAVSYLLALGHTRIAFVGGPPESPLVIERKHGFCDTLEEAGLAPDPRLFAFGPFSLEAGARAVDLILAHQLRPTAFCCASDELAIGAMHALRQRKLFVPVDVSVIGFDDIAVARYLEPPLTTVAQPSSDLGREAMIMLLNLLGTSAAPPRHMVLPTQLVVRGSTARVAKGAGG